MFRSGPRPERGRTPHYVPLWSATRARNLHYVPLWSATRPQTPPTRSALVRDQTDSLKKGQAAALPPPPRPTYGRGNRWAVLAGVDEYEDWANYGRLRVCVQDVEALRAGLLAGGFETARLRSLLSRYLSQTTCC